MAVTMMMIMMMTIDVDDDDYGEIYMYKVEIELKRYQTSLKFHCNFSHPFGMLIKNVFHGFCFQSISVLKHC